MVFSVVIMCMHVILYVLFAYLNMRNNEVPSLIDGLIYAVLQNISQNYPYLKGLEMEYANFLATD